jgi:hypothetical protein
VFIGSVEYFLGRRWSVSVSSLSFDGAPPGGTVTSPWRPDGQLPTRTRSFVIGDTSLTCEEYAVKPDYQKDQVEIRCTTPGGELSCTFFGDRADSGTFYRIVERIKKTK